MRRRTRWNSRSVSRTGIRDFLWPNHLALDQGLAARASAATRCAAWSFGLRVSGRESRWLARHLSLTTLGAGLHGFIAQLDQFRKHVATVGAGVFVDGHRASSTPGVSKPAVFRRSTRRSAATNDTSDVGRYFLTSNSASITSSSFPPGLASAPGGGPASGPAPLAALAPVVL